MTALRNQVTFREPFIAPQARVKGRFKDVLFYGLAGLFGLLAVTGVLQQFVFAA